MARWVALAAAAVAFAPCHHHLLHHHHRGRIVLRRHRYIDDLSSPSHLVRRSSTPGGGGGGETRTPARRPRPSLSPGEVVAAQMDALQKGELWRCFKFASPANKAVTGPWQRFARMVTESDTYSPMVWCSRWQVSASLAIDDETHIVRVRIYPAGSSTAAFAVVAPFLDYDFTVSRQRGDLEEPAALLAGCWLTDSVMPVPRRGE